MSNVTVNEIVEVATRMAQELQDFIGEAELAGCHNPFPATVQLLDEWENVFQRATNLVGNDDGGVNHE